MSRGWNVMDEREILTRRAAAEAQITCVATYGERYYSCRNVQCYHFIDELILGEDFARSTATTTTTARPKITPQTRQQEWHSVVYLVLSITLLLLTLAFLYCCYHCLRRLKVNPPSAALTSARVEVSTARTSSDRAPTPRPLAAASRTLRGLHRAGDITRDDVVYIVICPRSDLGLVQWYLQNPDLNVQRILYVSPREDGSVSRPATPPPPYPGVITASAEDAGANDNQLNQNANLEEDIGRAEERTCDQLNSDGAADVALSSEVLAEVITAKDGGGSGSSMMK